MAVSSLRSTEVHGARGAWSVEIEGRPTGGDGQLDERQLARVLTMLGHMAGVDSPAVSVDESDWHLRVRLTIAGYDAMDAIREALPRIEDSLRFARLGPLSVMAASASLRRS